MIILTTNPVGARSLVRGMLTALATARISNTAIQVMTKTEEMRGQNLHGKVVLSHQCILGEKDKATMASLEDYALARGAAVWRINDNAMVERQMRQRMGDTPGSSPL